MDNFNYEIVADPAVFRQGRMDAHADHRFYRSEEEARRGDSSYVRSLNGEWYFHYAKNYDQAPKSFGPEAHDYRDWDKIHVPAHMQMEGYGHPQYCNTQYPWDGSEELMPGEIPAIDNPVGTYATYFKLPEDWKRAGGKTPVFINFRGAESALALWCNGRYVGYAEDSFTPSEFELTDCVTEGENLLVAQVFRFSAGSWYEDQDFFRFSGLFRDVELYTIPSCHVRDLKGRCALAPSLDEGDYLLDLVLEGDKTQVDRQEAGQTGRAGSGDRVRVLLLDPVDHKPLAEAESPASRQVSFCLHVDGPKLWSAEQ